MDKVIIILAVLLFTLAALSDQAYEIKQVKIEDKGPTKDGFVVEGVISKRGLAISVHGTAKTLGYVGRLVNGQTPILCTSSNCKIESFTLVPVEGDSLLSDKYSAVIVGTLVIDQNSDGKAEFEKAQNVGYVDLKGSILLPDVRFSYIESARKIAFAPDEDKSHVAGVYDARAN